MSSTQGFNEFLTSKSAQAKNKNRQFRLEDRVFSLSSITSPGVRALAAGCIAEWPGALQAGVGAAVRGRRRSVDAGALREAGGGPVEARAAPKCATGSNPGTRSQASSGPLPPCLQTMEMQAAPADPAAGAYGGVAVAPPAFQARAVAQAPPPKRRY